MNDLSSDSKDANTDTETVRAAILSGSHISEERGASESYVLRRLLLDCITSDSSATVAHILWSRRSYTHLALKFSRPTRV